MAGDNRTLGRFILDGIPPAPRGMPQIEVKFDLDANGILNVSARDKATGKEQKITITSSSGLSDEEIEKMRSDAEAHAEEDKKKKELAEARNIAETSIITAQKAISDAGDKLDPEVKKDVEEKITKLEEAKKSDSIDQIKTNTDELGKSMQRIGEAMYKDKDTNKGAEQKPEDKDDKSDNQENEKK